MAVVIVLVSQIPVPVMMIMQVLVHDLSEDSFNRKEKYLKGSSTKLLISDKCMRTLFLKKGLLF